MKEVKLTRMVLGYVIRCNSLWRAVRVRVPELAREEHLNMYYEKETKVWAATCGHDCKVGDIVRILPQEESQSHKVHHEVREVVFPVGRVVDPITGRRCRGPEFINEELRRFGPQDVQQAASQSQAQR